MRRIFWLLPVSAIFALSACGGGSSGSTSDSDPVITDTLGDGGDRDNSDTTTVTPVVVSKAATISSAVVETWKGGATAAYSIIHDDFCQSSTYPDGTVENWRELESRGLVAGFGAVASWCGKTYRNSQTITAGYEGHTSEFDGKTYFRIMAEMQAAGMEIVNHSNSHPTFFAKEGSTVLKDQPISSWQSEIDTADRSLRNAGLDVSYFAFPEDQSDDTMLAYLKDQAYLGARGGEHAVNAADLVDEGDGLAPFKADFDCFNLNQVEQHGYNCSTPAYQADPLKLYLDATISAGGWGVRELHGIDDTSWGYVTPAQYTAHLDYVKAQVDAGRLWVATPTAVTRYWAARQYCSEPVVSGGQLDFNDIDSAGNCIVYGDGTLLDLQVTLQSDTGATLAATQDGEDRPLSLISGNRYRVSVAPTGGTVMFTQSTTE